MKVNTKDGEIQMRIAMIPIFDQPIRATLEVYGLVDKDIERCEKLVRNPGNRFMGVWSPKKALSFADASGIITSMSIDKDGQTLNGRSATIEELASYETEYQGRLGDDVLFALDEKIATNKGEQIAYRGVADTTALMGLRLLKTNFHSTYHFLIVFDGYRF